MADTTIPVAVATNALSLTTGVGVVVFGVHTGLDYPTLLAGIFGGATALSYLPPSKLLNRAFEVGSASLLAGYSSPVLAEVLTHTLSKLGLLEDNVSTPLGLQFVIAFGVGYLAHGIILPGLRKIGSAYIRRKSNE